MPKSQNIKLIMKNVLIVVDYQNDFVSGTLGFESAKALDEKIAGMVIDAKVSGDDVIFTYDTHNDDYLETNEGRNLPIKHCIRGTNGWNIYGKTAETIDSSTLGFEKNTFGSLELAEYLKAKKYDRITLVGVVTNICVLSNAVIIKSALPESQIIVDSSAVASPDSELQQATLKVLQSIHIAVI